MEPVEIDYIFNPILAQSNKLPPKIGIRLITFNVHGYTDVNTQNTRSQIIELLGTYDADFICLQEHTGSVDPIDLYAYTTCDYEMFKLVIYYKENIPNIKIHKYDIENSRCIVGVSTDNLMIVNIHLSPILEHGIEQTICLSKILESTKYIDMNICLCGDFNAYDRDDYDEQRMKQLISIKSKYYRKSDMKLFESIDKLKQIGFVNSFALNKQFRPMNTTRFGGIVDHILLRTKHNIGFTNVWYTNLSDHIPVYCDLIEPRVEQKSSTSEYLESLIGPNLIELSHTHIRLAKDTDTMSADKYGDTWFKYNSNIQSINNILVYYKASGFRPINRFIAINTIGDLFAPPEDKTLPDDTNPLIRCISDVIISIDSKMLFPEIISTIFQHYITMYINDINNPLIHDIIYTRITTDYENKFVQYKSLKNNPHRHKLFYKYNGFTEFKIYYEYLADKGLIPINNFIQYIKQFIQDGKCADEDNNFDEDNQMLLMNVFLNRFILQLPRNPNPFVTYRSLGQDLVRSKYYNQLFVPGAIIPIMHLQSTGLLPFDYNADGNYTVMLEILVPADFPAYFGYMHPIHSMEKSEIILPYCDKIEGNELSYAYRTRSYENKTTKQFILFDELQVDLPEIKKNIANATTEKILLINADTSQTPPKIHKTYIDHYVVVDIIHLDTPIPNRYIPSKTYDIQIEQTNTSHNGGYFNIYRSYKQNYQFLKINTI